MLNKKKIKLITTFASLGLALALMVFGVYAAVSGTVTVNSNVSYKVGQNVIMKLTGASAAQTAGEPTPVAITDTTGVTTNGTEEQPFAKEYSIADVALEVGEMAVYTIKIENLNKNDALKVSVDITADGFTVGGITEGAQADIAAAGQATYTITFTPTDTTKDIPSTQLSIVFTLTCAE